MNNQLQLKVGKSVKRILALLLVLILIVGTFQGQVSAEEGENSSTIAAEENSEAVTVEAEDGSEASEAVTGETEDSSEANDNEAGDVQSSEEETTIQPIAKERLIPMPYSLSAVVYLDGAAGDDGNDGTQANPVKTFEKAKSLLAEDGLILFIGQVTIDGTETWSLAGKGDGAKVQRAYDATASGGDCLIEITAGGVLTLENIVIDGDYYNNPSGLENGSILGVNGGRAIMKAGTILENNGKFNQTHVGGVLVYNDGFFEMQGGTIRNCDGQLGGAVRIEYFNDMTGNTGGTFIMSGNALITNCISWAGSVFLRGLNSEFTMNGGTISDYEPHYNGNIARAGVVVQNGAVFTMNGGLIEKCDTTANSGDGGAVAVGHHTPEGKAHPHTTKASTFTMNGGEIRNSKAANGGAVYVYAPQSSGARHKFIMTGGTISSNNAVNGGGVYIARNADFAMSGGVISGNNASSNGGGIYFASGDGVDANKSIFTMSGTSQILENNAVNGAGVYLSENADFTMSGGEISKNIANGGGGGVYLTGISYNKGVFTMSDTAKISENRAANGAGVYINGRSGSNNNATFMMTGGEISENNARSCGGGVMMDTRAIFTMTSGIIKKNTAVDYGGGISVYAPNATANLSGNALLEENTAEGAGNGVYVYGTFNIQDNVNIHTGDYVFLEADKVITVSSVFTGATTANPISLTTSYATNSNPALGVETTSTAGKKLVNYTNAAGGQTAAAAAGETQIFVHINIPGFDQDRLVGQSQNSSQLNYLTYVSYVKVTFDPQGGTWSGTTSTDVQTQKISTGKTVTEPSIPPVYAGYTFEGWYKGTNNNGTIVYGTEWDFNDIVVTDLILYAKWKANEYKIVFDKNTTDTVNGMPADREALHIGDSVTEPTELPVRAGYIFNGWSLNVDGSGGDFDSKFPENKMLAENVTFYAQWTSSSGPSGPSDPTTSTEPSEPTTSTESTEPTTSTESIEPTTSTESIEPSTSTEPSGPSTSSKASESSGTPESTKSSKPIDRRWKSNPETGDNNGMDLCIKLLCISLVMIGFWLIRIKEGEND